MRGVETKDLPVKGEDLSRVLTFTSFWGSIFYLYASISQLIGARRQAVNVDVPTVGLGLLFHLLTFVGGGTAMSLLAAVKTGKSATEQAEKDIGGGTLERTWFAQGLAGGAGSIVPFLLAVTSQRLAGRVTGRSAIDDRDPSWPVAGGIMVILSGLTALAVSRITAWVAEDAKRGS
jgi:energy-converting hydrogenase Eha subunit E